MTSPTMRAKLYVTGITEQKLDDGTVNGEKLTMSAVGTTYDDQGNSEDNTYAKYSPSASFEIYIANPALFGNFKYGDKFYVDFTPADVPVVDSDPQPDTV